MNIKNASVLTLAIIGLSLFGTDSQVVIEKPQHRNVSSMQNKMSESVLDSGYKMDNPILSPVFPSSTSN